MKYVAGLDVSTKETSICIVDDAGSIVLEAKVSTEPAAIIGALTKRGTAALEGQGSLHGRPRAAERR